MGFVYDDEAEILDGGENSGTRANDDLRLLVFENIFPK